MGGGGGFDRHFKVADFGTSFDRLALKTVIIMLSYGLMLQVLIDMNIYQI